MRTVRKGLLAALLLCGPAAAFADKPTLTGEYVEARTCNVYIGACHANGEAVTAGREAMLAWHINQGTVEGQTVAGLNVVAVLTGKANLGQKGCDRTSVVYVDSRASDSQREALVDVLQEKYGCALGRITLVKSAPIEFTRNGLEYTVRVPGTAYIRTTRYACDHCVMPHQVWYSPFIPVTNSLVAKASVNEYKGKDVSTNWRRVDENSSFVGEFSI